MFTGIIEELGLVKSVGVSSAFGRLKLGAAKVTGDAKIGDSIAVNGVCLTIVALGKKELSFDVAEETIRRTNLSRLKKNERVNLERPLKTDGRFGGHFVSGHIDALGRIKERFEQGENLNLQVELPERVMPYLIEKGSLAVDGVSLTIVDLGDNFFTVSIIPHTRKMTTLGWKDSGEYVNIEVDILGKYIQKFTAGKLAQKPKITQELLKESGFI